MPRNGKIGKVAKRIRREKISKLAWMLQYGVGVNYTIYQWGVGGQDMRVSVRRWEGTSESMELLGDESGNLFPMCDGERKTRSTPQASVGKEKKGRLYPIKIAHEGEKVGVFGTFLGG